jgi:hypothetical protein
VPPAHGQAATGRIIERHIEGGVAIVRSRFVAVTAWQSRISSARAKLRLGEIVETALFVRIFSLASQHASSRTRHLAADFSGISTSLRRINFKKVE